MILNEKQNDALTELINIAFARAAASLSELTGDRVLLDVPSVDIHAVEDLSSILSRFVPGEVAIVHQDFSGPVAGDALLLLNYDGAIKLVDLLTDESQTSPQLDTSGREVLTEVGNILLNACLGMFGNLLHVSVNFSVPYLHLETLESLINSLLRSREELRYAIVVFTSFHLRSSEVNGYLVVVLGVASMDRLIQELEIWEQGQDQE
jgi:chemotaxis protein CheC